MKNPLRPLLVPLVLSGTIVLSPSAVAQSAEAGQKKAAMCLGCHSIAGYQSSFPEIYKVPMIAGQGARYIAAALAQYKKGDRRHPTMRAIAVSLTDQDMADLAAYYATQGSSGAPLAAATASASATPSVAAAPSVPAAASAPAVAMAGNVPADIAALLAKSNCASCHGANMNTPIDPGYPKLAGQHADYLFFAMKAYKTPNNPQIGRNNPIMKGMAAPYTLAELKRLSGYIASMPSELKTVPQSNFR